MGRSSEQNQFALEVLEPRILLSADAIAAGLTSACPISSGGISQAWQEEMLEGQSDSQLAIGYDPSTQVDQMFERSDERAGSSQDPATAAETSDEEMAADDTTSDSELSASDQENQ